MAKKKKDDQGVPDAPPELLETGTPEVYVCEKCGKEVGAERVLVLLEAGQAARHPDCHAFSKAMH